MKAYQEGRLEQQQAESGKLYLEFLRESSLSMGLYVLPAGGVDPQRPHREDEVYVVVRGRGHITVGDETQPVTQGSIVYVGRGVSHFFHDIAEELAILVFFAPPESEDI